MAQCQNRAFGSKGGRENACLQIPRRHGLGGRDDRILQRKANLGLLQRDAHWFCFFYTISFGGFVGLATAFAIYFRDEFGLGAAQVWGPDALPAWEVDVLVSAAAQRADAQRGKDGLPGG